MFRDAEHEMQADVLAWVKADLEWWGAIMHEVMDKQCKGSNATGLCQSDTRIATGVVQLVCAKEKQTCGMGAMLTGLCQRDTIMWDGAKQCAVNRTCGNAWDGNSTQQLEWCNGKEIQTEHV